MDLLQLENVFSGPVRLQLLDLLCSVNITLAARLLRQCCDEAVTLQDLSRVLWSQSRTIGPDSSLLLSNHVLASLLAWMISSSPCHSFICAKHSFSFFPFFSWWSGLQQFSIQFYIHEFSLLLSAVCESLVAAVWKNRPRNVNLASCLQHHSTETGVGDI